MPDTEWAVQYFVKKAGEISPGVRHGGYAQHWLTGELEQQLQLLAAPGRKKWAKHFFFFFFKQLEAYFVSHMNHSHFTKSWPVLKTTFDQFWLSWNASILNENVFSDHCLLDVSMVFACFLDSNASFFEVPWSMNVHHWVWWYGNHLFSFCISILLGVSMCSPQTKTAAILHIVRNSLKDVPWRIMGEAHQI